MLMMQHLQMKPGFNMGPSQIVLNYETLKIVSKPLLESLSIGQGPTFLSNGRMRQKLSFEYLEPLFIHNRHANVLTTYCLLLPADAEGVLLFDVFGQLRNLDGEYSKNSLSPLTNQISWWCEHEDEYSNCRGFYLKRPYMCKSTFMHGNFPLGKEHMNVEKRVFSDLWNAPSCCNSSVLHLIFIHELFVLLVPRTQSIPPNSSCL